MRSQLPAWSPLSARALVSALGGLVGEAGLSRVEERVRREYGPAALRLTDSGTSALALALKLASTNDRPLVALPAYSCYDLATAADIAEARVLLYDVDPATLGPDWASFGSALAAGPSSAVVVHLYGLPVDMERARAAAEAAGVTLIEDAAQGVGGRYRGRLLGTQAPLAVLSFGRGKGRTGGRGGALLVNDDRYAPGALGEHLVRLGGALSEFLLLKAQWLFGRPSLYGIPASIPSLGLGQTVYRLPHPIGRMSGVAAAALAATWGLEPAETSARRANATRLGRAVGDSEALSGVILASGADPGYLRLPVVARADDFDWTARELRRLGIMPGYPGALPDLEGFQDRIENPTARFPGARLLATRLGTLPTHSRLTPRDLAALESTLAQRGRS